MGRLSTYPNGFADGISIRGMPLNIAYPGQVFFLNNSGVLPEGGISASDSNNGTYLKPFNSLNYAVTKCVANRGDIIMVMPGHAEAISSATAMSLGVAGVCIVGMGQGSKRPTFTLNTANTATINVTANNIAFVNCVFVANFLAIASCFTLTAANNFVLQGCSVKDTSAILNFARVVGTSAVDNAADGLVIEDCDVVSSHATNAFSLMSVVGNLDRAVIKNNRVRLSSTNAAALIPMTAGKLLTNALISGNDFNLVNAAGTTTGLLITTNGTTNSGMIKNNSIFALTATGEILVTANAGFKFYNNLYSRAADTSGFLLPTIGSV